MLNKISIHGHLVRDPELRTTPSGVSVCNFTVAVDRSYTKQGEEKQTDFFECVAWRGVADTISKYFHKGKEIVVSGKIQSRKWQDKDGNNRISWEIMADSVDFCGSKGGDNNTTANNTPNTANVVEVDFTPVANDSDLLF